MLLRTAVALVAFGTTIGVAVANPPVAPPARVAPAAQRVHPGGPRCGRSGCTGTVAPVVFVSAAYGARPPARHVAHASTVGVPAAQTFRSYSTNTH